jgi:HTH-type transcriptional regulator/antitoxin HigA
MEMNLTDITAHWVALHEALGLGAPIQNEAQYAQLLEVVDALMDDNAAADAGPMAGLLVLLADRIRAYEDQTQPWPEQSTPASRLAFLMEQHGLRQSDLPELGPQSVVSELLRGKRTLNMRQTVALAKRFALPLEAFV